jgi:FixJ family two-component response regulator
MCMKIQGQVYLIDDDVSMRESLVDALPKMGYLISDFPSANLFLQTVTRPISPAVILLDMQMPDMNGGQLQREMLKRGYPTPIIFISGQSHPQQIINGFKDGAVDFILKPFLLEALENAIQKALKKDQLESLIRHAYESLTPREKEVFIALAQGRLLKEIAFDRQVSESVIKMHKTNLMNKLQVNSLQELAIRYVELGLANEKYVAS